MAKADAIDVKPLGLAAMGAAPAREAATTVDMTAWYEEHIAQLHQALYLAVKGLTAPGVTQADGPLARTNT